MEEEMDETNDERMSADRTYRGGKLTIAWSEAGRHGLIGRVSLDGEHWASVEWSEKRQQWCIEDVEGRCLTHAASIRGKAASKEEAVALAEAMIRDGRMPSPAEARATTAPRKRAEQEKKAALKQKCKAQREASHEAFRLAEETENTENEAQPLYEMLDEAFDLASANLWKSNSFAALKPRLILHVDAAIARLAYEDISYTWRDVKARLARAKAIYRKLTGAEWAPSAQKERQASTSTPAPAAEGVK
jgi:hypothetical protein